LAARILRRSCPALAAAGPDEALDRATRFENLFDLARWLAGAALYIGNDSGITHLAAAVGIPVIALFGPTSPDIWAPRGPNVTVLREPTPQEVMTAVSSAR
jgi:heptosyltransferase III